MKMKFKKAFQYTSVKISIGLLTLITLFFVLLPFGASYYLKDWLVKNGAESASIESIRFNPFLGRLTVRGVDIKGAEKKLFHHSNLVINIGLTSLFERDIHIQEIIYQDIFIDLQQHDDGSWRYGSFSMVNDESTPKAEESLPASKPWFFSADQVSLNNCKLRFLTPDIDMLLTIDSAELKKFTTREQQPGGTFHLTGDLDGSPISIDLNKLQVKPALQIDGDISISKFNVDEIAAFTKDTLPVFRGNLSVNGKVVLNNSAQSGLKAQYQGNISANTIHLEKDVLNANVDSIGWDGKFSYTAPPKAAAQAIADGNLGINGSTVKMQEMILTEEAIQWKGKVNFDLTDEFKLTTQGDVQLGRFDFQNEEGNGITAGLDGIAINDIIIRDSSNYTIGTIVTDNIEATVPGEIPLQVNLPKFSINGLSTDDLATFTIAATGFENLQVRSTLTATMLARLQRFSVKDISANTEQDFSATNIGIETLLLLSPKENNEGQEIVSLARADLNQISWNPTSGLNGDTLNLSGFVADIVRDKDGVMNFSQRFDAMKTVLPESDQNTVAATPAKEHSQSAPITFSEIALTGDSKVSFIDQTLAVPYSTNLEISTIRITDLDSTRPEKQMSLLFEGNLEKRAPIKITGEIDPFKEKPAIHLDLLVKNYPLTSLSSYTVQSVGTTLAGGQLKVTSKLNLTDDTLDLKNSVFLEQLETDTISQELADELNNQLPIPLDAALAMLRDSDRNINLEIPISGPINDISVGISDIVVTALSKSIVSAASSYFVYALGPYAALAYVGMKVGEEMMQVNLPPVQFQPGEQMLKKEHTDYLERIANILKERPETDLQLSPMVASWELFSEEERAMQKKKPLEMSNEQKQLLDELGQQRAAEIQNFLSATHSIDKTRLLVSSTSIKQPEDTQPAVILEVK